MSRARRAGPWPWRPSAAVGTLAPLWISLAALAAPALQEGEPSAPWSSVERELWVREQALAPLEGRAGLEAALADPRWVRRAASLEALRRAWRTGTLGAGDELRDLALGTRRIAADARAPERAQALLALAEWPSAPTLDAAALESALDGPPAVALALARLLERGPAEVALPRLGRLAEHADPRVAAAALEALAARGDGDRVLAQAVAHLAAAPDGQDLMAGLERLERSAAGSAALDLLAASLAGTLALDAPRRARALADVEAVRLIVHAHADLPTLVAGWPPGDGRDLARHALHLRAARSARAHEPALCAALLDAAALDAQPWTLLEGAVESSEPHGLLALAAGREAFLGERGEVLWRLLLGRASAWAPEQVAPWLAPASRPDLRAAVLETVAATFGESADPGSGRILVEALDDPEAELAALAFRALCAADDPGPWIVALHDAWRALAADTRVARLRWLPRRREQQGPGALGPFRADLLELGRQDLAARAECAELLGSFADDGEVGRQLALWLGQDLGRLLESSPVDLEAERRAVALVRALGALGRREDAATLDAVARAAGAAELAVAKTALAVLGPRADAAEWLEPWLDDASAPRRLRIEAALQLAPRGSALALQVLDQLYDGCDAILRARALRAATALERTDALALLRRVARDGAESSELRRLALEGLGALGARDALLQLLAHERHPDARDAAIGALGAVGDPAARSALTGLLEGVEARERPASAEELAAEREALLLALAAIGASSPPVRAAWLRRPLDSATADLEARLRGERLAPPPFRFRGELALAGSYARQGRLALELDGTDRWWSVDGRLLGHLGVEAQGPEPQTATRLLEAAWIALEGEAEGDDGAALRLELRRRLLALAEAQRDWGRLAALTEALLADWRALRVPTRLIEEWLGPHDPARGSEPRARLESAALQARAWEAHGAGRQDEARALAAAARARLGASAEARAAQATLEAELGGR